MVLMENTNYTIVAVAAIICLIGGYFVGTTMAPTEITTETIEVLVNPLQGTTIRIGNIQQDAPYLETETPLFDDIITVDINNYLSNIGYDVDVEFLTDSADGQAAIHLEKVQSFKAMDITIFHGGLWSSQAQAALSYVNDNDMLMISSESTSPLLAIPNDRLFRTCPTDYVQAPAIAEMWQSWGIDAVLILQRGDSWADGIYNLLEDELELRGISIIERVRYAAEVTEFSSYLSTMDGLLEDAIAEYGVEHVGVHRMSFAESVVYTTQTADYPNTRAVIWMGCEDAGRNQRMLDDAGGLQVDLRMFSSLMTPAKTWKWESLGERYFALVGQQATFYTATKYDSAWLIALSVIEAGSIDANDVAPLWPGISNNFFGASGWVDLDENGDRKPGIFDIWGYTDDGFTIYGQYNGIEIAVNWYDDVLDEQGIVRPGQH